MTDHAIRPGDHVQYAVSTRSNGVVKLQCAKHPGAALTARGRHQGVILMRPHDTAPAAEGEKRCMACGKTKPLIEFSRYHRSDRGPGWYLRSRCKPCHRAPRESYPTVICEQCGRIFKTNPVYVRKGTARFCSRACQSAAAAIAPEQQLERHVDRSGGPESCWPWMAHRDKDGYGRFSVGARRQVRAHRAAWEIANGRPVPEGLLVRHLCEGGGNPWCCNPKHLQVGTVRDNREDMVRADRDIRGERSANAKLTDAVVIEIRQRVTSGESRSAIARELGVTNGLVSHIALRRAWKHVP